MLTVRLATAPAPDPLPGVLRIQLEGLSVTPLPPLIMPPPGVVITAPPISAPLSFPTTFPMTIAYYLNQVRVGVKLNGIQDGDSLFFFASPIRDPALFDGPGVLCIGNIMHGDMTAETHDCPVQCEHGTPVIDECCVICRDGNLVTKTCC